MAFLFNKFQEAVKVLSKSPTFARNPRQFQFETDINRLFLYTSYNRLGRYAEETDVEEIIQLASKASVADQQKQVQENIHCQINNFCKYMDEILIPDVRREEADDTRGQSDVAPRRSGLSLAVGKSNLPAGRPNSPDVPETRPLNRAEVSERIKELMGYTLELRASEIPHEDAGQGLFLNGEADVGSVIAFYPGVIYCPAYYRYIPGYPRVDAQNPYLITRYDGTVINGKPWGSGGDAREVWDGLTVPEIKSDVKSEEKGSTSDRMWKMVSKPMEGARVVNIGDVLERRNPLALAHFANHPAKGMNPNVMICPYDFPLTDKEMRTYIPNISFGNAEVTMRRFGSFWFRMGKKNSELDVPVLKSLVLVSTRVLCNEEVLLNYRLSNSKRRPAWYTPVDEEEDKRRWS